jgi:hypothetical protein
MKGAGIRTEAPDGGCRGRRHMRGAGVARADGGGAAGAQRVRVLSPEAGPDRGLRAQGMPDRDPRRLAHADEDAMAAYCEQSEDDIRALVTRAFTRSQSLSISRASSLTRSGSQSASRQPVVPEC